MIHDLKYNSQLNKNPDLESQLDTVNELSKELRKFFEKHRELTFKNVAVQADLVRMCNMLFVS